MTERFNCTKCDARMMTPAEARAHDCPSPAVPAPQQDSLEEQANKAAREVADRFAAGFEICVHDVTETARIQFLAGAAYARSTWEAEREELIGALKKWALSDTVMEIYRDYPDGHTLYGWQLGDYRRVREALSRSKERP